MDLTKNDEPISNTRMFMRHAWTYFKFTSLCLMIWGLGYVRCSPLLIALGSFGYFGLQFAKNKRAQLTDILKDVGRNEKEFFIQNFPVTSLPSWIYFPDVDRAEWLNKIIQRVWPFICEYVKENILKDIVEPAISEQCPTSLKPFKFIAIDLGDTPPRIGGVKVYMGDAIQRDEVIVDVELIFYSDARIKVQLGKLCAGVKDFELRGTLRIVLKPLVPKVPFTGAVTLSFLDSPYINFELTDMANVLAFPGLQQTLDNLIRSTVNKLIVLPNRFPIQLLDDVDVLRLKYPMPEGVMRIGVLEARDLIIEDKPLFKQGSSDPYCVIRVGAETFKTQVVWGSLNPKWNDSFEAVVADHTGQTLELEVFDKDQGNQDDHLGRTSIPVESVFEQGELNTWASLEDVKSGSVHLALTWLNLSSNIEDVPKAQNDRFSSGKALSRGFLYVVVEQARHLKRLGQMREPSPICKLSINRDEQQTTVKERTQDPTWQSVHWFLINEPYVDILRITIQDKRTAESLGKCSIPVKRLLTQQNMSTSRPFPLEESGSASANIYLHLEYKALIPKIGNKQLSSETQLFPDTICGKDLTPGSNMVDEPASDKDPSGIVNNILLDTSSTYTDTQHDNTLQKLNVEVLSQPVEWSAQATPGSEVESNGLMDLSPLDYLLNPSDEMMFAPMGQIRLTIEYRTTSETLRVTIHEASNLHGVDKDGLADPYVRICIVDASGSICGQRTKTDTIKNSLNPTYDTSFEFDVNAQDLCTHGLRVDVRNRVSLFTRSGRIHQMGSVYFALSGLVVGKPMQDWFTLVLPENLSSSDN